MIWLVLAVIFGYIIYSFLKDRDAALRAQVDSYGGVKNKYSDLVRWLTSDPNSRITKITRDSMEITAIFPTTKTIFFIQENFGIVEVSWEAYLGRFIGNHKLEWKFPHNENQFVMIEKISSDLQKYENKIFK